MDKKLCKIMPPVVERFLNGTKVYSESEVIDMLTELQAKIEKLPANRMVAVTDSSGLICYGYSEYEPTAKDASKVIQQKINQLRSEE